MSEPAEPYDPARQYRREQAMRRLAKVCFTCLRSPPEVTFMQGGWPPQDDDFCTECAAEFAGVNEED